MTESSTSSAVLTIPQFSQTTATDNTTTFNILQGNISGTVTLHPLVENWVTPELRELLELEPGTTPGSPQTFSRNFQGGSFTLLNDPAQYQDGSIVLDFPTVGSSYGVTPTTPIENVLDGLDVDITNTVREVLNALDIEDAQDGVDLLDKLFNVTFTDDDDGTTATNNDFLTTGGGVTGFDFNYSGEQNALIIDGYNSNVVDGVFAGEAKIETSGNFSVDIVLSELLNVVQTLSQTPNITISPIIPSIISSYQAIYGNELTLASGSFDLEFSMVPASESLVVA